MGEPLSINIPVGDWPCAELEMMRALYGVVEHYKASVPLDGKLRSARWLVKRLESELNPGSKGTP